ncbi:MAG: 3-phosphoshikimate 1-carboxyvinyltransferase [Pirellulaceae bacterium]|nr:3-phosphoshikimate 1-carboxyvinyltransferase [Pirellulaceae bacterium]
MSDSPDQLEIAPVTAPVRGNIRPPGSKSITNRALVCAALAEGTSTLTGALDSEDTRVMIDSLGRLGIRVESLSEDRTLIVHGCGGRIPAKSADLFVGNSGTTIRFLTALCALGHGTFRLDGVPRMRERPIGDLLEALNQLGASCRGELKDGFPPVIVQASGLPGGTAKIRGNISSQYLSGLMMSAPSAAEDVQLVVAGKLVSQPYVRMTQRVMESFGSQATVSGDLSFFRIPGQQSYRGCDYAIEPDASAASYFWAAAAITGGEVTVEGLTKDSLQGDVAFVECLAQMGCRVSYERDSITVSGRAERGIDVDMNAISDTVQTLAPVALFADGPTTIRGVGHIRHKETDRIGDLARELRKLGATVDELPDGLRITPPTAPHAAEIATYHDHRMAMSLALAGLVIPGVVILDPGCTAKTYPGYFDDLGRLCGISSR